MKINKILPEQTSFKIKDLLSKDITKKAICVLLLMSIALLSIFGISKIATSPETYTSTIESINEKKVTVALVTTAAATTATALSLIPGDSTTPVANQIMQISSYLFTVVCMLVLEKSLLTVMGYVSFNILIPLVCILLGFYIFTKKAVLKTLSIKLLILALVIVTIVPFSVKIGDLIYEINIGTIEQVTTTADIDLTDDESQEDKSWLGNMLDKVKNSVANAGEKAKEILNKFIDAIAIFIITCCVIPIIVVLFMVWFVNSLFSLTIPTPNINILPKLKSEKKKKDEELFLEQIEK